MLHTVEVGSFHGDLIAAMSNMMTWLDTRGSQAVIFPQLAEDGTGFRPALASETEPPRAILSSASQRAARDNAPITALHDLRL